jgi:hypothetical protein
MSCIMYFTQPLTMATTEPVRVVRYKSVSTRQLEQTAERKVPSMSWVVVTDNNGNRTLQMQWAPPDDLR